MTDQITIATTAQLMKGLEPRIPYAPEWTPEMDKVLTEYWNANIRASGIAKVIKHCCKTAVTIGNIGVRAGQLSLPYRNKGIGRGVTIRGGRIVIGFGTGKEKIPPLAPQQNLVWHFAAKTVSETGHSPSLIDIAAEFNIPPTNVNGVIKVLENKGYLHRRGRGSSSTIHVDLWPDAIAPRETEGRITVETTSKTRNCLKCRKPFQSSGHHQQICGRCKETAAWQDG